MLTDSEWACKLPRISSFAGQDSCRTREYDSLNESIAWQSGWQD